MCRHMTEISLIVTLNNLTHSSWTNTHIGLVCSSQILSTESGFPTLSEKTTTIPDLNSYSTLFIIPTYTCKLNVDIMYTWKDIREKILHATYIICTQSMRTCETVTSGESTSPRTMPSLIWFCLNLAGMTQVHRCTRSMHKVWARSHQ